MCIRDSCKSREPVKGVKAVKAVKGVSFRLCVFRFVSFSFSFFVSFSFRFFFSSRFVSFRDNFVSTSILHRHLFVCLGHKNRFKSVFKFVSVVSVLMDADGRKGEKGVQGVTF